MRIHTMVLLTTAILSASAVAIAKPQAQGPQKQKDDDSVQITMTASKGRLGVQVLQISSELRTHLGAPADRGVLIDSVRADSPAAKAGLRVGDVVTEVDGAAVQSATDVLETLAKRKKGDAVPVAVMRGGQRVELKATLEDDPGVVWQRNGKRFDPQFKKFFDDKGGFDSFRGFGNEAELRQRIEELEKRLDKLEQFH